MLGKLRESDGIPLMRFVLDLNLALELDVTGPLEGCSGFNKCEVYYSTVYATDEDANISCCLGAKWREKLGI